MSDRHETTADIIAWLRRPREGENAYLTAWRDEIADRLDAAHKRERGDAAKLREALKRIVAASIVAKNANAPEWILQRMADIFAMATTALAAPPRNCDMYSESRTATKFDAIYKGPRDGVCVIKTKREKNIHLYYMELCKWIFAPATEKEGDNDGNE